MRIAHVIARLNVGGPAVHVALACSGLTRRGHDAALFCGRVQPPEGDMGHVCAQYGVEPTYVESLGRSVRAGSDVLSTLALVRLFREWRPDVVHTHTAKAGAVGRAAARLAGVPAVVHTFHGHVLTGYFGPVTGALVRMAERALARLTDAIVTVTEGQRRDLLRFGVGTPAQHRVIPYGLDLTALTAAGALRAEARREFGIPADARVVGIVGRLTAIKGHGHFLDMAERVAAAAPDVRFAIAGDGELRSELEASVDRLGLRTRTHFLGWRQEMPRVYGALDVLVLTSLNEGSPFVLTEAMAAGVPCVAHAVGGVPDIVEDGVTGYLVPAGQPDLMRDRVLTLIGPGPSRDALIAAARAHVLSVHGVDAMIDRMEGLYRDLRVATAP